MGLNCHVATTGCWAREGGGAASRGEALPTRLETPTRVQAAPFPTSLRAEDPWATTLLPVLLMLK